MKNIFRLTSLVAISSLTFSCGSGQQKDDAAASQEEVAVEANTNDGFEKIFDGESLP